MNAVKHRIVSLDVFRGIIIVLMILVNSQAGRLSYPILLHASWNGCTLADMVFPSFLFIVGISIVVALRRHQNTEQSKRKLYQDIFKRTLLLFLLGMFLNIFPRAIDLASLRYFGVLQRIAICYCICSLIYLHSTVRSQIILFMTLLVGYWYWLTQIAVPGFGANVLTPQGSWVAYVDQLFFSSKHLFGKTYDPEGMLSTIPAIATTLSGVIIGYFLMTPCTSKSEAQNKCHIFLLMFVWAIVSLLIGWTWSYYIPFNKSLWTSSFVLWSSGFALLLFSLCYGVIDILGYKKWTLPFKIFGMNALFAFVVHILLLKAQMYLAIRSSSGELVSLRNVISNFFFGHYVEPYQSLYYGIVFLLINFIMVSVLYRRKIFIRL